MLMGISPGFEPRATPARLSSEETGRVEPARSSARGRFMASGLRLELSETTLAANPGGAVTTRCTVYNTSLIVDEYRLQVSGIDPSWVEMPEGTSRIFPEAFETVTIAFKPPRSAGVAAG